MTSDEGLQFTLINLRKRYLPEFPALPLATGALIIGCGTLGCSLSRQLLSWGVQNFDLVDNGVVRPTNPTRQSLFTSADIGRKKAVVACEALQHILPSVSATPHCLTIPSPGLGCEEGSFEALEKLITTSDIVFLCTDTRESRWLPTALCSLLSKPSVALGLGFDSYL